MHGLIGAVVVGAVAFAGAARADDDANARAQKLYADGDAAYKKGDFTTALDDLQQAYSVVPLPALLFNIAQCYRRLGDHEHAVASYEKYAELEKKIPAARKKELTKFLAQEKKLLAADTAKHGAHAPTTPPHPPADIAPSSTIASTPTTPPAVTPGALGAAPDASASASTPTTTPSSPSSSFVTTPATPATPASAAPATATASADAPLWTNPIVIGGAIGVVVIAAAGGTTLAVVNAAPGPAAPKTSLGTVDLRK